MVYEGLDLSQAAAGEARLSYVRNGKWYPATPWRPNLVMYDAATLVSELLRGAPDGKQYQIGAVYLEFENAGGAVVTPPTFGRDGGKSYYDGLLVDPTLDYIRAAVTAITLDSTDLVNYPGGNRLTVFAQSEGVVGVHGKTFSDGVSSRIFGGALVVTPVFTDQTQDLALSRMYFSDTDDQLVKLANSQIGLTWRFKLV